MHITINAEVVEVKFDPVEMTIKVLITSKKDLEDLANEEGKAVHAVVYAMTDHAKGMVLERIRDATNPVVVLEGEKDALGVKTMGSRSQHGMSRWP